MKAVILLAWWFLTWSPSYPWYGLTTLHGPFETEEACGRMESAWRAVKASSERITRRCFEP
jgi:hypothetical protein